MIASIDEIPAQIVKDNSQELETPRQQSADGYFYSDDGRRYIVMPDIANNEYFQNGLRNDNFTLQRAQIAETRDANGLITGQTTSWLQVAWQELDFIQDALYTEDDALAESEYERKIEELKREAVIKYMLTNGKLNK